VPDGSIIQKAASKKTEWISNERNGETYPTDS